MALASVLARQGFVAAVDTARPFVLARRGACRVKARIYDPYGTDRQFILRRDGSVGPVRFAYRGRWTDEAPKIRPLLQFYVQRELARVGIATPRPAIVSMASARGCPTLAPSLFDLPVRPDRSAHVR